MEELPAGQLKATLQTLDPQARGKAMKWLHEISFPKSDAEHHLRVDDQGGIYIVCPITGCEGCGGDHGHEHGHDHAKDNSAEAAPVEEEADEDKETSSETEPGVAMTSVPISSPPAYNSKPDAPFHIYIDFNGAYVAGKQWSSTDGTTTWTEWDCLPWSLDSDRTTFSAAEQVEIRRIWERIAEDYAPFNVNVTTDVTYDPDNYTGDKNKVGWLLVTPTTDKNGARCPHFGAGGVAYVNVFGRTDFFSRYQPAWVTPMGTANTAEAASHEMGHNLGLSHDGLTSGAAYYGGHVATASAPSWGPIMGTGYNRNVSQWSKASEYYLGNQAQDDLAIIAGKLTYRDDDHGDTFGTATPWLTVPVNQQGIVERTNSPDFFTFNTAAGSINFNANTYRCETQTWGGNLDILLELYNESQQLIASHNPGAETHASITMDVPAGRYYLVLRPTGAGDPLSSTPSGYTVYGSLGQYTITGNFIQEDGIFLSSPGGGESWLIGASYDITWGSAMGGNVKLELFKEGSLHSTIAASTPNNGSYSWTIPTGQPSGSDYKIKITSIEQPSKSDESASNFTINTDPLGDALDTVGLVWTTSGNEPWFRQATTTQDGVDAAQSGGITHNQTSNMQTTIVGPGTMTFWWKVSSEQGYDFLRFFLNGVEQTGSLARISGNVDWMQKTVNLPTGSNVVEWKYTKDGSVDANADMAWVDQVVFTPSSSPLIVVEQPAGTELTDGAATVNFGSVNVESSTQREFTIKNNGTADLTGLALSKSGSHSADYTLGSLSTTTLVPGASTKFTVTFAPGAEGTSTALLQIASNDTIRNPFDINLTGNGLGLGSLAVAGTGGLNSSGNYGGPFSPSSIQYTLSNTGSTSIEWTAAKTENWVTLSVGSGTLADGASTTVTVSINSNANSLNAGSYNDTVTFTNTTNGTGNTTRAVALTVNQAPITVTFDPNGGGTPSPTHKSVTYNTTYGTLATVAHTGHTFNGWFTAASGGSLVTKPTTVTATEDHSLYAQWSVSTYTVSYDSNEATSGSPPVDQTKTFDVNMTLATNSGSLARTGYEFNRWNTAADGSETSYDEGALYTANASATLYAEWTANTYTVTFDANDGEAPVPTSMQVTYGSPYDALATTTRNGYIFNGWFTAAAGESQVTTGTPVAIAANHTLYAQWTQLIVEMDVSRSATLITVGGYDAFDDSSVGTGAKLIYDIANGGNDTLTLSGAVISGENNCVIVIDSQPSASVAPSNITDLVLTTTPATAGPWSFTVSIANNHPDKNPYQWTVHGVAASSETVTLTAVADTYIDAGKTGANYGNDPSLSIWNRTNGPNSLHRYGLLRFDLSTIPSNTTIASASISLVQNNTSSGLVDIVEVTGSWSEAGATWDNSNTLVGNTSFGSESAPGTAGSSVPSITLNSAGLAKVQSWLAIPESNYGFGVKTTNSANKTEIDLFTREHATAAHHPRLSITYTVDPQIAKMHVTRDGSTIADEGTDSVPNTTASTGTQLTYQIVNLGNATLTMTTPVSISSATNCSVQVNSQPASTVVASATTSMVLTITPATSVAWSATLSITNNDPDANPYNWTISGVAATTTTDKTTPTIHTWPTAAAIVEGQSLASATLSGGSASVAGGFAHDDPSVIPAVGPYLAAVTFTPEDTASYHSIAAVVTVAVLTAFDGWADGDGLAGDGGGNDGETTFEGDANNDGVPDGLAWLLGAADPADNAVGLLPEPTARNGNLETTFRMLNPTQRGSATLGLEYSANLATWTTIQIPSTVGQHHQGLVQFDITEVEGTSGHLNVTATLDESAAGAGGKVFVRLSGELPAP